MLHTATSTPAGGMAARLLAASPRLSEPGRTIFRRLFIVGESEEAVRDSLQLSSDDFTRVRRGMLTALMKASQ